MPKYHSLALKLRWTLAHELRPRSTNLFIYPVLLIRATMHTLAQAALCYALCNFASAGRQNRRHAGQGKTAGKKESEHLTASSTSTYVGFALCWLAFAVTHSSSNSVPRHVMFLPSLNLSIHVRVVTAVRPNKHRSLLLLALIHTSSGQRLKGEVRSGHCCETQEKNISGCSSVMHSY